jgi:hypothetical protein
MLPLQRFCGPLAAIQNTLNRHSVAGFCLARSPYRGTRPRESGASGPSIRRANSSSLSDCEPSDNVKMIEVAPKVKLEGLDWGGHGCTLLLLVAALQEKWAIGVPYRLSIHLAGHECRREGVALTPNDESSSVFGCGVPKSRGISTAIACVVALMLRLKATTSIAEQGHGTNLFHGRIPQLWHSGTLDSP